MRPFHTPALQVEEAQTLEHGLHAAEPAEAVHIGHLLRSHHEVAADVLGEVPVGKHIAVLLLRHTVVFVDGLLGDVLDVAGVEVGGAVVDDQTGKCAVIDPGYFGDIIISDIDKFSSLDFILLTHGHYDHFAACLDYLNDYPDAVFAAPSDDTELMYYGTDNFYNVSET